jgi:putative cardiolipin synthase
MTNFYPKDTINLNNNYQSDKEGQDIIALIDNNKGLQARINLIENAQETIDIIQFYINDDEAGNIFINELLLQADKGIQVRIIIDGKYNHISGLTGAYLGLLTEHPNIKVKLYEPFQPLKPWTINNFLHDKILIIDNKQAMISGRNIGNRYFSDDVANFVYDLDSVVTFNGTDYESSALKQISEYFTSMWNYDYSVYPQGVSDKKLIADKYQDINKKIVNSNFVKESFNWDEISVPTNNITLISNPFDRFNKQPLVWNELANLINKAKKEVFINSPYIVPTKEIARKIELNKLKNVEITMLTNSPKTSPNILAFSGYLRYKNDIIKNNNINVYEYQGLGSLHSKSYIIDDYLSIVGSFNLDPRSAFLSTETMLVVDSDHFASLLKSYYQKQLDYSLLTDGLYSYKGEEIIIPPWKKNTFSIMRHVVALIDHLV